MQLALVRFRATLTIPGLPPLHPPLSLYEFLVCVFLNGVRPLAMAVLLSLNQ